MWPHSWPAERSGPRWVGPRLPEPAVRKPLAEAVVAIGNLVAHPRDYENKIKEIGSTQQRRIDSKP